MKANTGKKFREMDRILDKATIGPVWLKDPRVAGCVRDALQFGATQLGLYQLHAHVIKANHVHILIEPFVPLPKITRAIKGFTARQANQILGRVGDPFWQDESFDHWVRSDSEFRRIAKYIEANPVSAGLVEKNEDWPWSSANRRAGKNACPTGK